MAAKSLKYTDTNVESDRQLVSGPERGTEIRVGKRMKQAARKGIWYMDVIGARTANRHR